MVRRSLDYETFIYQAKALKFAADENLTLFSSQFRSNKRGSEEFKNVALYYSTMLLYAVCVENLFKAIGLYHENSSIQNGRIKTYKDFMKKWKSNSSGHYFSDLIDYYNISITDQESKVLKELQNFSIWAGRFPFPLPEEEIEKFENNSLHVGKMNGRYERILADLFERNISMMTEER